MSDSKVEFKDIKYLVFEGGGGKGAAYTGAIEVLEYLLSKGDDYKVFDERKKRKGILDYYQEKEEEKKLHIKGMAGTSAGAITAFALTLGLNSDEINKIFDDGQKKKKAKNYDFTRFLSIKQEHTEKYRMVSSNKKGEYTLQIAEDVDGKKGEKQEKFEYSATARKDISGNSCFWRRTKIALFVNIIIDGTVDQVDNIQKIFTNISIFEKFEKYIDDKVKKFLKYILKAPSDNNLNRAEEVLKPILYRYIPVLFLKWIFSGKVPSGVDVDYSTVGNIIWEGGIYSGFEVREFFFDLLIYALSKKTHFRRQLIAKGMFDEKILKKLDNYVVGTRPDIKDKDKGKALKDKIVKLGHTLTFKKFHEITDIDFGVVVTNGSTASSLYFSYKHTPDYPVLEAVAASMNIPGAFKPIYSDADVMVYENYYSALYDIKMSSKALGNSIKLYDKNKKLDMSTYYLFQKEVKQYLSEQSKTLSINLNTEINENGFLPILRDVIARFSKEGISVEKNMNGIEISKALLCFFYNSAYKGLLVDGGTANNIPYNFFRDDAITIDDDTLSKIEQENDLIRDNNIPYETGSLSRKILENSKIDGLKGVLAFKLDNDFPPEVYNNIHPGLKTYMDDYSRLKRVKKDCNDAKCRRKIFEEMEVVKSTLNQALKMIFLEDKDKELKDEEREKLFIKMTEHFIDGTKGETPWNKPRGFLDVLGGALMYGSEHGQVQSISDHKHIIPLYTYNVGTMDFDMKKIPNFVKMSQRKATEDVEKYFNIKSDKRE